MRALVAKERIFAGQLIVYDYGELFARLAKTFVDRCPSSDPRSIQSYLGTAASLRYFGPPACRWHLTREQLKKRNADAIDVRRRTLHADQPREDGRRRRHWHRLSDARRH